MVPPLNPHGAGDASPPGAPAISTASSTATANYRTSDVETTSGTTTGGSGVSASTSTTVTETKNIDQYAFTQAASPAGFSPGQPNAAGNFFSGSASSGEVDIEDGWNHFGTAQLSYDDASSETDSYSFFTTTDTTPGSGAVFQESDSRSMTSTTSETGSYLTNPPGAPAQATRDNPMGEYASLNDRRQDNVSVTASVSLHEVATGGYSSWTRDYAGTASSSLTSDRTVTVIALSGTDLQSGSYSRVGEKTELSTMSGGASEGGPAYGMSWQFGDGRFRSRSIDDSGTYAGGGTQTVTNEWWDSWGEKFTVWGESMGHAWSYTSDQGTGGPPPAISITTSGDTPPAIPINPPDPPPYTLDAFLDDVQLTLDVIGFVFDPADILNGFISLGRGDKVGAGLSFLGAIPGVGSFLGVGGKIGKQIIKHGDEAIGLAGKAIGKVDEVTGALGKVGGQADNVYDVGKNELKIIQDGCFFAGTVVTTQFGDRPVETVEAGERFWAFDLVSGQWRLCTVLDVFVTDYAGESVDITGAFGRIESTQHHPFWVVEGADLDRRPKPDHLVAAWEPYPSIPGRWVDAHDLRVGDVLFLRDGRRVAIEAIASRPVAAKVYNFEVEDLHNYAVGHGGVLVHNSSPCGGGRDVALSGNAAEEAVSRQTGIPLNRGAGRDAIPGSGPGGVRFPDLKAFGEQGSIAVRGSIIEVKDVARLEARAQIRDMIKFVQEAKAKGAELMLEIFSNAPKPKSGAIKDAIDAENVIIQAIE